MATFSRFNKLSQYLAKGQMNLATDTLKVVLTNTAPVATNNVLADITQLSSGNGYTTGGATVANNAVSLSTATATLAGDKVSWTASGGSIGPFRYWVLYDDTPTTPDADPLIAWWDHGSTITITSGGTFSANFNGTDSGGSILAIS